MSHAAAVLMKWTFGECELDSDRYVLRRGGEEVHAEPRVIETLAHLVAHRDRVVSKAELVEDVWSGAYVTDSALKRAIQEARRVLGDDGERQEIIETVWGRGYRFVAEVEEGAAAVPASQAVEPICAAVEPEAPPETSRPRAGPDGVRRHSRLATVVATLALSVSLLAIFARGFWRYASPSTAGDGPLRLLVLPFEYVGPSGERWFAAGLTEEVTTRLAAARDVAVLSRTTAEHYAADRRPLGAIGREAGLDYVLEGAVLLVAGEADSAARVRVTSQLIRVDGDEHVWAGTFDRRLDDIFVVQAEIARAVTDRLDLRLGDRARGQLESPPTEDLVAYRAFLAGSDLLARGETPGAVDLFRRAAEIDPGFVLAWARLGYAHSLLFLRGRDATPERAKTAKEAMARAMELAPDDPEVRRSKAMYAAWVEVDYRESLRQLDALLEEAPLSPGALRTKAWVLDRLGRFAEARDSRLLSNELEPRPEILYLIGFDELALGRFEEAERHFDEAIAQAPGELSGYLAKAWHRLAVRGDAGQARSVVEAMPEVDEPPPGTATFAWWPVLLAERSYDEALERLEATQAEVLWNQWTHWPRALMRAQVLRLRGEPDLARVELESALASLESDLAEAGNALARSRVHGALGLALAGLGWGEDAIGHGCMAVELGGVGVDAFIGPFRHEELAETYLLIGEHDRAIEVLEDLVTMPSSWLTPARLRIDPRWDALRSDPRFQRLAASEWPKGRESLRNRAVARLPCPPGPQGVVSEHGT